MDIKLITQAIQQRSSLRPKTNAMRLVNGQADGLPGLTIDCYNRHFLIQQYLARPTLAPRIAAAYIQEHLSPEYLIIKNRTLPADECMKTAEVVVNLKDSLTQVKENQLIFQVDLNDAVNPGLFLDMRANRLRVAKKARDLNVLNCFAYTCSFGVYCKHFGAKRVVNLDISKKCLKWGQVNYQLNSLPYDENEFIYSDCSAYFKGAQKWKNRFDLIVLDPPSFSRHAGETFSVKTDLTNLIDQAIATLNPGGRLFLSTNCSSITNQSLETWLGKSCLQAHRQLANVQAYDQDIDFPYLPTMRESHLAAVFAEIG